MKKYIIRTKVESKQFISKHNLNQFDEKIFMPSQTEKIKNYLNSHDEKYFIIRTKCQKFNGNVYFKLTKEEVWEHINEYELFSLDVAAYNYIENKILIGDILITDDLIVTITATSNKYSTHR